MKIGIFFKYDGSLTTLYTVHLHQTRAPVAQHSNSVHGISTSSAHMSLAYAQPLVYVTCIFVTCICMCCHPGRSVLDGRLALPSICPTSHPVPFFCMPRVGAIFTFTCAAQSVCVCSHRSPTPYFPRVFPRSCCPEVRLLCVHLSMFTC